MNIYNDKTFLKAFNKDKIIEFSGLNLVIKNDKCLNPFLCQKHKGLDNIVLNELANKFPGYSLKCAVSEDLLRFCAIKGFLIKPRINYTMTLGSWSIDNLKSAKVRRNFRKSVREYEVSNYLKLNELSDEDWRLVSHSSTKYSVQELINKENFMTLSKNQFDLKARISYNSGLLSGLAIFLKYDDVLYYLWGAGEVTAILVETLQDASIALDVQTFDFEGSSIQGVEYFYSQFEPQLEIYAEIFFKSTKGNVKRIFNGVLARILSRF